MCPTLFLQSDLGRIAFGALRAVPKRTSSPREASRRPLVFAILKKEETTMCSATLTLQSVMMRKPVRMNWVVITDTKGNRRPQMHWETLK
jgi:hypothetical protein